MVSLWGTKNDEEDRPEGEGEGEDGETTPTNAGDSRQPPRRQGGGNPDERTRLIPPRREGLLSPDDPAVSLILPISSMIFLLELTPERYLPTTCGVSEHFAISQSSFSS